MTEKKKRSARDYGKIILICNVVGILLLIVLANIWSTIRQSYSKWQLNQAMNRWEQNEPDYYRYRVMSCSDNCTDIIITVKDGEIVGAIEDCYLCQFDVEASEIPVITAIEDASFIEENYGIEQSLQRIQDDLRNGRNYSFEFDEYYGYPRIVTRHECFGEPANPITGFCETILWEDSILQFEVLSDG